MPKRKKMKDYGNRISTEVMEELTNNWYSNKNEKEDLVMVSVFFEAEGGSLLQVIIAEDELYNGIFHLKRFEFNDEEYWKLEVDDLDVLHDPRRQDLEGLFDQLPEIAEKYDGILPNNLKDLSTKKDILKEYKELPLLVVE